MNLRCVSLDIYLHQCVFSIETSQWSSFWANSDLQVIIGGSRQLNCEHWRCIKSTAATVWKAVLSIPQKDISIRPQDCHLATFTEIVISYKCWNSRIRAAITWAYVGCSTSTTSSKTPYVLSWWPMCYAHTIHIVGINGLLPSTKRLNCALRKNKNSSTDLTVSHSITPWSILFPTSSLWSCE